MSQMVRSNSSNASKSSNQSKNLTGQSVPIWAITIVAVFGVVIMGYFGWRTVVGKPEEVGPAKKVFPGMYDIRAEAAKMQNSQGAGSSQNGN